MNNKSLCLVPILFILLNCLSCSKYLDKKSNTQLTVPSTLDDLQELLDDGLSMNTQRTPSISEASTDNYFLLETTFETRNERGQAVYKWVPFDNYGFPNDWSYNYLPVYNANFCLETISKIEINNSNTKTWDNVKGSSLFYRAYYFLQLVWTFSKAYDESSASKDLGIALRLTSDFNAPSVRASVRDCYDKIISDTKESVAFLPDMPVHPYRPSKAAAYGLLARTYLTMRQYDSALKYAGLSLQIDNQLMDYNGDEDIPGSLTSTSSPFAQFNKETIFYTEASLNLSYIISPSFALMDTSLYASYELNDLRKKAFFTPGSGYQRFKGQYSHSTIPFSGIATDEMYLTRAECYARGNNTTAALNDLNTLLAKRYDASFVPVTAADNNDALAKILMERRKELLMRGLRFIDIKRLNKEGANITPTRFVGGETYTIQPNDDRYALPLPLDVITESGMPQN